MTAGYTDGQGTVAQFSGLRGVFVDTLGRSFVSDSGNHRVRVVSSTGELSAPLAMCHVIVECTFYSVLMVWLVGDVRTFAGSGSGTGLVIADGIGTSAVIPAPFGIYGDSLGILYVGCSSNSANTGSPSLFQINTTSGSCAPL